MLAVPGLSHPAPTRGRVLRTAAERERLTRSGRSRRIGGRRAPGEQRGHQQRQGEAPCDTGPAHHASTVRRRRDTSAVEVRVQERTMPEFRCKMLNEHGGTLISADLTADTLDGAIRQAAEVYHTSNLSSPSRRVHAFEVWSGTSRLFPPSLNA